MTYDYKVVPAPKTGLKTKGAKTTEERFANALEATMNGLSSDGWEYLRADTLPCEQREGLMGKATVFQNMLIFRRARAAKADTSAPVVNPVEVAVPAPHVLENRPLTVDPGKKEPTLSEAQPTSATKSDDTVPAQ
jgi:hypothetical protein